MANLTQSIGPLVLYLHQHRDVRYSQCLELTWWHYRWFQRIHLLHPRCTTWFIISISMKNAQALVYTCCAWCIAFKAIVPTCISYMQIKKLSNALSMPAIFLSNVICCYLHVMWEDWFKGINQKCICGDSWHDDTGVTVATENVTHLDLLTYNASQMTA